MANLTTREFWASTAERAVRTAAQTAIALIGTDQIGILNLDWGQIISVVATATILSLLTSVAGDTATKNGPAFVHAEGIGIENAEAEEALRRERAGETIDTSTAVSFVTDASEGDSEEGFEDDLGELSEEEVAAGNDEQLEELAADEVDDTPPAEGYRPRH
ncbi:MAG: holin [Brevibacterium sp.]|uniref:holin n=1 Tax=Brevibacterium sp. TaxID=1701 RepID=UPI003F8F2DD2